MPRERSALVAAAFFGGAGIMHFVRPDFFESVVPDWFPDARLANQVSGAAEIALAAGLLSGRTRRASAYGLVALTAAVFPANIDMAVNDVEITPVDGKMTRSVGTASGVNRIANFVRLPLQIPMAVAMWKIAKRS